MMGILLYCPVLQATCGWIGMIVPSTNGPVTYGPFALGVPCSCRMRAAVKPRRHAELEQPAAVAKLLPRPSATWAEVMPLPAKRLAVGELWLIARWNSPAAA